MTNIDYSKCSLEELRQAEESIDKEKYPDNYRALLAELDTRGDEPEISESDNEESTIRLAEKRVKIIGYFQLAAAITIPLLAISSIAVNGLLSIWTLLLALMFAGLNGFAGYTAVKEQAQWYWVSLVNQSLQLFSFAMGSVVINYSGLGGIYLILNWGEGFNFSFNAAFTPGFHFALYPVSLTNNYFSVDLLAILFVSAIATVKKAANDES